MAKDCVVYFRYWWHANDNVVMYSSKWEPWAISSFHLTSYSHRLQSVHIAIPWYSQAYVSAAATKPKILLPFDRIHPMEPSMAPTSSPWRAESKDMSHLGIWLSESRDNTNMNSTFDLEPEWISGVIHSNTAMLCFVRLGLSRWTRWCHRWFERMNSVAAAHNFIFHFVLGTFDTLFLQR